MTLKQISLSLPENLFEASQEYTEELGYRNLQEFILELVRSKVMVKQFERYKQIEEVMKAGKNVKKFSQKDAVSFVKSL